MTEQPHPDVLGLRASLPAPGWTVLDTAREQRFTGELRAHTDNGLEFHVYVDRGEVYCAERSTDPTLGIRLVEAGAINTAQLEYGMLRIGEIEHLGRLFDRVPSINRDAVFVLNQLMTEETMRSMAARSITDVEATPYRHHPSGMHRWTTLDLSRSPAPWGELPELALPAPAPDARPVSDQEPAPAPAPAPAQTTAAPAPAPDDSAAARPVPPTRERPDLQSDPAADLFLDDVVQWDEPSMLVSTTTSTISAATTHERRELFPASPPLRETDWVDELGPDGVGDAPAAPATHAKLPPVAVPPVEQFEVIWPSGEVDDVTTSGPLDHGHDTSSPEPAGGDTTNEPHDTGDDAADEGEQQTESARSSSSEPTDGTDTTEPTESTGDRDDSGDEPAPHDDALAVRRAVATIDTGSLAVRRRLASPGEDLPTPPGRLIVGRDHHTAWRNGSDRPTGSVFDAQPAEPQPAPVQDAPADDDNERRAGALRRLIGSLRKTDD